MQIVNSEFILNLADVETTNIVYNGCS